MGIFKKSPSFNAIYEISSSAGIVFLGMFLGEILMFATRMIAARSLGPADYGVLSLGLVILALFQTLSLIGLPPAISRYIPFYLAKGQLSNVKGTITSGLKIAISASFFLAAFLFVSSQYIAVNIFKKGNLQIVISIFALTIPFTVAAEYFYASLRGFKKTKYAVLSKQLVFRSCTFLFLIILLALNIKLVGASIAYSLGFIIFALTSLYFLNFRTFSFFKTDVSGSKMAKTLLSFS
ncbi:TPA: hypothetical protein EYP66_22740, partial [Candidatus Poribacteria bacterium]|nr:hypothetical protein [Candidatus Poribacteria bacterium]